jgi:hypothetical protein
MTVAHGCKYKASYTHSILHLRSTAVRTRALRKPRGGGARERCDRQGFGVGGVDAACAPQISLCKVRDKTFTLNGRQEEKAFSDEGAGQAAHQRRSAYP